MFRYEQGRPSGFGLAETERNEKILTALLSGVDVMVFNDTGDVLELLESFKRKTGEDVCTIDLRNNLTLEQVKEIGGFEDNSGYIESIRFDRKNGKRPILAVIGLDSFVIGNEQNLGHSEPASAILHLLCIAAKASKTTLVSYLKEENDREVMNCARKNMWLNRFISEHFTPIPCVR